MKIKEFLKEMNIKALAVAKIKTKLSDKSLTIVKNPVTL